MFFLIVKHESGSDRLICPSGTEQIGHHNYDIGGCGLDGCGRRYNMGRVP